MSRWHQQPPVSQLSLSDGLIVVAKMKIAVLEDNPKFVSSDSQDNNFISVALPSMSDRRRYMREYMRAGSGRAQPPDPSDPPPDPVVYPAADEESSSDLLAPFQPSPTSKG